MRGILINPWTREVTEVEVAEDYRDIYRHLSNPLGAKVDCFCIGMNWPNGDVLYVDDEGLFKSGNRVFDIGRIDEQPLSGNGLILGSDNAGNSVSAKSLLTEIQTEVKWPDLMVV